ncbi:diguanylate cyclase [Bacillus sp. AFS018417]|uniref:dipeptidase n=1 Tax=unclassified Bacillus (in: firmicutes) TaxID=185979 RepID=UPI000BF72BF0|nr:MULTISPECIES: dipeptidase [unclassified Bacillus (in: firmicutes)]MCP1124690.1 dipeptidase [Bacillus sp. 3103sda1]PEZ05464.1 diguanylate cyclase [Bacillus sp. AFS018417]
MEIFDAHCDVLWQLWMGKGKKSFQNDSSLHITYDQLKQNGGSVQCFAIYVPEEVPYGQRFAVALEMTNIFHEQILALPNIKWIRTKEDIQQLGKDEIGALLTLEGCDAIGNELEKLKTLYYLGVRSVGLTWNYANLVADGALESRGGGLTLFGKKAVDELNRYKVWTDVSHLSEKGFWDVIELANHLIASHSNSYELCQHPRNLTNEQIKALIQKDGMIGITFVPMFLAANKSVCMDDILRHVEHVCMLGGEKNVGFGSDFDGITETVVHVERYEHYEYVINELLKRYKEEQVNNFTYRNFIHHISF